MVVKQVKHYQLNKLNMLLTNIVKCLEESKITNNWNNTFIARLHNKVNKRQLQNDKPINLLCQLLKLLTKDHYKQVY